MPRRSKKQYKSLALVKTENIGHTGGTSLVAEIRKQQNQITSAWLEKLRVSYHIDSSDDLAGANRPQFFGGQFQLSTTSSAPTTDTLIAATGFNGFGGTCTLAVKRAIRDNTVDQYEADGKLYLHVTTTDLNLQAGDLTGNFTIEAWGRWHEVANA